MKQAAAYITGSCIIREHGVTLNGQRIWEANTDMELQEFLRSGYDRFSGQYPKFHKMDALSKLGWLAAEVLLQTSDMTSYAPEEVGLVLSNRSASLDTDLRYYDTVKEFASPALFVYTLPNIVIGEICIRHGFKGEHTFFVSDSFNAAFMTAYVQQLLATTPLQACLCGWVEVMEQAYEVVMYLVEKQELPGAKELNEQQVTALYK
ncbi:hypothetical protein [Chitinophaga defluvii]|uniref:Beta-ketoacyl synthase-like protein n=1 Tax=Chitinophaga defluvii TaxID=3163343 RepID=A0ABV2TCT8_9BACT